MQVVSHRGMTVGIEHLAAWIDRGDQIVRDLIDVLTHPAITPHCLRHLIANRSRLTTGHYELPEGHGCLMFVLTEPLGKRQIRSRADLVRFFGRDRGIPGWLGYVPAKDSPEYQPAKWLVRLVDGQFCEQARSRYGRSCEFFDYELVIAVAREVLAQRDALEQPLLVKTAHIEQAM